MDARKNFFSLKYLGFSIFFFIFLFEGLLRVLHIYETPFEQHTGKYTSYYETVLQTHYPTFKPNDTSTSTGEFVYKTTTNSDGFREMEFDSIRNSKKKKILILGDSFVAGVGSSGDSTWPALLQNYFNQNLDSFQVINCGIPNSDPIFETKLYEDKLYKLQPNLVILSINYSDINDLITRGGNERFKKNGTTVYRKAPWFEPFYEYSRTIRFFLHAMFQYDFNLISSSDFSMEATTATKNIERSLKQLNNFCRSRNTKFIVVIHPYLDPYDEFLEKQQVVLSIDSLLKKDSIAFVNLFPMFQSKVGKHNYKEYAWPVDKHFTPRGYDLFAQLLYDILLSDYPYLIK